jgi:hypothetical protein
MHRSHIKRATSTGINGGLKQSAEGAKRMSGTAATHNTTQQAANADKTQKRGGRRSEQESEQTGDGI